MKNILRLSASFVLLVVLFISCQKEGVNASYTQKDNPAAPVLPTSSVFKQKAPTLYTCPGYTLKMINGEFSCPSGAGCSKVQTTPCPSAIGTGSGSVFVLSNFDLYKDALTNGTLTKYFSTKKWQTIFPDLINHEEILDQLQSGKLTMVEENYSDGSTMELAVPSSKCRQKFTVADVQMALSIPKGIIGN